MEGRGNGKYGGDPYTTIPDRPDTEHRFYHDKQSFRLRNGFCGSNKPLPQIQNWAPQPPQTFVMATKTSAKQKASKTVKPAAKKAVAKPAKKTIAKKKVVLKKTPVKKPAGLKRAPAKTVKKVLPKKKAAAKKQASGKKVPAKTVGKTVPKKRAAAKKVQAKTPIPTKSKKGKIQAPVSGNGALRQQFVTKPIFKPNLKLTPFLTKQRQRLLQLKDTLLDSMSGVARGNLHSGSETSAFGMHQADAGSDAYDRDFAMSILSQEQNSLYEIDEALKRIEDGIYGQCEICNKPIPQARLEARPFTRTTVDCQEQVEKRQHHNNARLPINSLFGLSEEEAESEEEEGGETL